MMGEVAQGNLKKKLQRNPKGNPQTGYVNREEGELGTPKRKDGVEKKTLQTKSPRNAPSWRHPIPRGQEKQKRKQNSKEAKRLGPLTCRGKVKAIAKP